MVDENQSQQDQERAPPPVSEQEDPEKRAREHFGEHVKAIATAATAIGKTNAALRDARPNDKDDLHRQLDTEVAQLHLAVNNAVNLPDEDELAAQENTGGAATTKAVDPRPRAQRQGS